MNDFLKKSLISIVLNCLLLCLSFLLFTGLEHLLRNDIALLHWYAHYKDLFSSEVIQTLTHHEPRSVGHSSALTLSFDSKAHGKVYTRADLFSFSITGNLVNKSHNEEFSELFQHILRFNSSNAAGSKVEPCIKVSLALRGMDMNVSNSKDIFIHLPFQETPPINVSLKIGDHFSISPFSRCYIAMLQGRIGRCSVTRNQSEVFMDFEEFQHTKESSRFHYVATLVYQEALFFYLNQDLPPEREAAASIEQPPPKHASENREISPMKVFVEGNKLSCNKLSSLQYQHLHEDEGVALHNPTHSILESTHSALGGHVLLQRNLLFIKTPKMNEQFPRHSDQVTVVFSVKSRVIAWLEQAKLPYFFTFILNDQRLDVTEQVRPHLLAEYAQFVQEGVQSLHPYKLLAASLTGEDFVRTLADGGDSIQNMLSFLQLEDSVGQNNAEDSSDNVKSHLSVSLFINGDVASGDYHVGIEMWCCSSSGATKPREFIASDSVRIHKL